MSNVKTKPAVQLVLGSQAITFPLPVTVKKLDGSEATVTFTCKAMRKTEWAKTRDDYHANILRDVQQTVAERTNAAEEPAAQNDNLHTMVSRGLRTDADLVLQFATAWDLSDDLTPVKLQDLEDEFGGTLRQAINGFEAAIYQGRLGN